MRARTVGRRAFTVEAALAILGGVTISVSGCRDMVAPTSPDPTPLPTPSSVPTPVPIPDKTGVFLANHGHTAAIASAHLVSGKAIRLDIRGAANHPHILELSAHEIEAIANNRQVGKESSTDKGHTHYVTFN